MQDTQMTKEGFTAQIRINGKWTFVDRTSYDRYMTTRTSTLSKMIQVMKRLNAQIRGNHFESWAQEIPAADIRYVKVVTTWTVVEEGN